MTEPYGSVPGPKGPGLTVVVPCHNEAENLARFEGELFPALDAIKLSSAASVPGPKGPGLDALVSRGEVGCFSYEVVIIDDGSTDATADQAATLAAARSEVRLLRLSPNRGLGGALRAGFSAARGEWIATLDADLTFPPAALKDMLAAARETNADLVAGSPYLKPGDMDNVPWARRGPSLMMNALYRGLFGRTLTAYTPIFRLYRAERLKTLSLCSEGFEINAEIAARALRMSRRVAEIPVPLLARTAGVSKLRRRRELRRHLVLIARLLCGR